MASTSSETPSLPGWKFDVFLSFRGEDTRHSFTDHLYEAFILEGIEAFRDNEKLQLGQEIASELIQAIENSQYAIVVFSEKYADSKWCLDELAKIVECKKSKGLKEVVPVFYHVDPSDVRNQTGPFEKAFDEHQKNDRIDREKIQKWKDAMREVGKLSGEHLLPHQRSEAKCIKVIVKEISNKLNNTFSADTVGLIGMESRVEKLKSHLAMESNDVRIIGIWGTGGMGKTTLARVVYKMISSKFEACSFIANIREESEKFGLHKIQQILLRELLTHRDVEVHNVYSGVDIIKRRLHNKKILLVLDDVNDLEQLNKLAGERCWFGSGSRIMITTRDKHLLELHESNEIYEVEELNHDEALKLFSLKAFKMDHPTEDYGKLSQAFVNYSKGLPLALEVLGSFLFGKNIDEWKSELDRLNEFPERRILDVLRISFDGLQPIDKKIFLNIACFFNHMYRDDVKKLLDDLGLYAAIGLTVLIDKSLIKLHENRLGMHDLLQEMGRDIVHQECPEDPGKRSRLWLFEDIDNVLTKNTGTNAIQGIVLKLREPKMVYWNPDAFSKMQDLKLLVICGVQLMHDLKHLPNSLRILYWRGYPSNSLTSSFQSKCFENLKFINMSESLELTEVPGISAVPNLETLVLEGCINLRRIHPSSGIHKKLTYLNLARCKNLTSLPSKFEMESLTILVLCWCSKITKIPEFGRNMKSLHSLNLSGTAITTLPTSIEHLTALQVLHLYESAITKLPKSIEHLTYLVVLDLRNCKNLVHLPNSIFNLKFIENVDLFGCSKVDRVPENLGNAESLSYLYLSNTAIPSSIGLLKNLYFLVVERCKGLSSREEIFSSLSLSPASSLTLLELKDCNLKAIPNDIGSFFSLDRLDLSGNDFVSLPESIIRLSKLETLKLNNCTSLRSLPKLPLKIERVEAGGCISLEMLPDPLKPSDSSEPFLFLHNCFQLADNQSCIDRFISVIKKSLKLSPSFRFTFQEILIPGSEIPEWFSHQSMGNEVIIKQPSHLYKKVGIAICVLFCTHLDQLPETWCLLTANKDNLCGTPFTSIVKILSDHLWLVYLTPQYLGNKLFSQLEIKIEAEVSRFKVKKCGYRMIYNEDIEDLDRTMVQYSNSSITPYDGMDVLHHNFGNLSVAVEGSSDYNMAGPGGEGRSDCEESSEYKACDEELSDWEKSSESDLDCKSTFFSCCFGS